MKRGDAKRQCAEFRAEHADGLLRVNLSGVLHQYAGKKPQSLVPGLSGFASCLWAFGRFAYNRATLKSFKLAAKDR